MSHIKVRVEQIPYNVRKLGGLPVVFLLWIDEMPGHATVMVVNRGNPLAGLFKDVFPEPPYVIAKDRQCLSSAVGACGVHDVSSDT